MFINLIANFFGKGISAFLILVLFPIYNNILGSEAFGLIAIYMTIQGVLAVLDFGFSATVVREMALFSREDKITANDSHQLLKTMELWYLAQALLIAVVAWFLAPWLSVHWLNVQGIDLNIIAKCLALMGLAIAFQWPGSLYVNALMGRQKQVVANLVLTSGSVLKWGGGLGVLTFFGPDPVMFFMWQAFFAIIYTVLGRIVLSLHMPEQPADVHPSITVILKLMKFIRNMIGISISATILSQADKLILSATVEVTVFGYYALAGVLASVVFMLALPFQAAAFPKLSAVVASGDENELERLYGLLSGLCSAVVIPVGMIIVFFANELTYAWTGDAVLTEHISPILVFLAAGSCLNAMMYLPFGLQVASGLTRIALISNVVSLAIQLPLLWFVATNYSVVEVAAVWTIYNLCLIIVVPKLVHRRVLPKFANWLPRIILVPVGVSLLVVWAGLSLMPHGMEKVMLLASLAAMFVLASGVVVIANKDIRSFAMQRIAVK